MIYVYAILEGEPGPPSLDGGGGLGDGPLRAARAGGSAGDVWAAYHPVAAAPRANHDTVWRHERVVERLMALHNLLPVRFGMVLRDAAALEAVLHRNRDALAAGLTRVRGCVELGVRAVWDFDRIANAQARARLAPPPPAEATSGRAYLLARAARERERLDAEAQASELAQKLNALFLPCARDASVRVLPTQQSAVSAAYLVERDRMGDFRARATEAGAALQAGDAVRPDLRLLCTGPWPPYHFVPALSLPDVPDESQSPAGVKRA